MTLKTVINVESEGEKQKRGNVLLDSLSSKVSEQGMRQGTVYPSRPYSRIHTSSSFKFAPVPIYYIYMVYFYYSKYYHRTVPVHNCTVLETNLNLTVLAELYTRG